MAKVVAVVPAYNEGGVIAGVIGQLLPAVDEVIVVDDGSRDQTALQARAAGATVLQHIINRGQGAAEETGTRAALAHRADIVLHFDADGQHDTADIPAMIQPILDNKADVVLGSRFLGTSPNLPLLRRLTLIAGLIFMRFFSGIRLTDSQNGFRAFSRDAAERLKITQDGMAHASEILDKIIELNLRYVEVPVTVHYTDHSLSASHGGHGNALSIVWRLLTDKFF